MSGTQVTKRADVAQRAFDMRIAGASYSAIAAELGTTPEVAYRAVERHLRNTAAWETRVDAGMLEVERLNRLTEVLWERAELTGNVQLIDQLTKLITKRANLLGLNFRDLVAEKKLELEASKVRIIAQALTAALGKNGIVGGQYEAITRDLFAELRRLTAGEEDVSILDGTEEEYLTVAIDAVPDDDEDDLDGRELL